MRLDIDETFLAGFNDPAKVELRAATLQFAQDLIREANRIEASRNPVRGNPQLTSSMVNDAAVLIRRGLAQPKKKLGVKIVRVIAAVLSLVVGFTYDATKLQDKTYMLVFVVVVAVAIIAATMSILLD